MGRGVAHEYCGNPSNDGHWAWFGIKTRHVYKNLLYYQHTKWRTHPELARKTRESEI